MILRRPTFRGAANLRALEPDLSAGSPAVGASATLPLLLGYRSATSGWMHHLAIFLPLRSSGACSSTESAVRNINSIGISVDPSHERRKALVSVVFSESAFPHHPNSPAHGQQRGYRTLVTFYISRELCCPEGFVRLRSRGKTASFVLVPVATVHKNSGPMAGKHEVRAAGEPADIEAESKTLCVQIAANQQLRPCVFPPVRCHHAGSDLR